MTLYIYNTHVCAINIKVSTPNNQVVWYTFRDCKTKSGYSDESYLSLLYPQMKDIQQLVDHELGYSVSPQQMKKQFIVFLCVSLKKKIMGCAFTEQITEVGLS